MLEGKLLQCVSGHWGWGRSATRGESASVSPILREAVCFLFSCLCSGRLLMLPEVKDRTVHSKEDLGSDQSRSLSRDEEISNFYGDSVTD